MRQVQLAKALADPTRLKILRLIMDTELCVCELQTLLQISQPAVSQQMAKLKAVGLVTERKAGMWTYYRGDFAQIASGLQGMLQFLNPEAPPPSEVRDLIERRERLDRPSTCK